MLTSGQSVFHLWELLLLHVRLYLVLHSRNEGYVKLSSLLPIELWISLIYALGISLEKMDDLFGVVPQNSKAMDIEQSARADSTVANDKAEINVSHVEKH